MNSVSLLASPRRRGAAPIQTQKLPLTMGPGITLSTFTLPLEVREQIKTQLTIPNPAYVEARKHGRYTGDIPASLTYYQQLPDGTLTLPRGTARMLSALFREYGLRPDCTDETRLAPPAAFEERVRLSSAQEQAVQTMLACRMGVLEAPAGSGKTVMAMTLIARRKQPTAFIVHTKELAAQAIDRASMMLGLDPDEIGMIGDGQCRIGDKLTVALVQTLAKGVPPNLLDVGHVVVDEAHHTPADTFSQVVARFPARYVLGLTATPYRRDGLEEVMGFYLGPVVARMEASDLQDRLVRPTVTKIDTGIAPDGDTFTEVVSDLVANAERNERIVGDVYKAAQRGRRCLILSDRIEHVEDLARLLQGRGIAADALHGKVSGKERISIVTALINGELEAVAATCSLIGEGFDCPRLDTLFLATPVSFSGRVEQYLGRISRTAPGKVDAVVYDYCDDHPMLWASWKKRADVYKRLSSMRRAA